ncbi:PAS domain S-box-containing protein [Mucilaginibacter yixingensis]|uniref:histidine kinase n=1 Tax=Mucilaginibacter yixingensis TaxID=1295612 RepID=A0A2T5J5L7_9SPHI|nr:PAS domain S-box protein [Mucilaginibacter yixingensis]PTQ93561.1 PAS domain S-box-containing protein [Mucilaginibacter yixingensis]
MLNPTFNQPAISLQQLSVIIDASEDAIVTKAPDGTFLSWNNAAEKILGYTAEEMIGTSDNIIIPEIFQDVEDRIIERVGAGETITGNEIVRRHKNGSLVTLKRTLIPITDDAGQVKSVMMIARDITLQKDLERKQLIQSAIIDSSDDAIISKSTKGIITSWNQGATRIFGYTEDEVVGKSITILIPEERLDEENHIIGKILKGERVDHFETIRLTKDGQELNVSLTISPLKNEQGEIIGASKIARDITRQIKSAAQLQRYAENLETLNSIGKSIAEDMDVEAILQKVTDATTQLSGAAFGAFFYNVVNETGEAYTLYTLSGAPRSAFENFGMPRNTDVFRPTFTGQGIIRVDDITKDPRYGHNAPHHGMPKGHLPVVSYLAIPVISKTGEVIGGLFYGHPKPGMFTKEHEDLISALSSLAATALDNAQLYREVQTLNERKDEFIGLASHELKTPVTSINGYLQIIESRLEADSVTRSFAQKARNQINRLSGLITELLDVSKIQSGQLPLNYTKFDLVELAKEVTELMQHSNGNHQIICDCEHPILEVNADRERVEQVIINLISNAIKYSAPKTQVIISMHHTDTWATLSVQDFGIGIDQEQQKHIFSRFYRAQNVAQHISGLGIGLYICKEIVGRHKGRLWVKSTPGEGSTFIFELPLEGVQD